ncbi:MAG: hypothetical protein AMXMBFR23_28710 [Chloroflexota bacterium]
MAQIYLSADAVDVIEGFVNAPEAVFSQAMLRRADALIDQSELDPRAVPGGVACTVYDQGAAFEASITVDEGEFRTHMACSCGAQGPCPHVAALALWLQSDPDKLYSFEEPGGDEGTLARPAAPLSELLGASSAEYTPAAPIPQEQTASAVAARLHAGMTVEEVRAWAREAQLASSVEQPLRALVSDLHVSAVTRYTTWGDRRTVAELLAVTSQDTTYVRELQGELLQWLRSTAMSILGPRDAEVARALRRQVPADPVAAAAFMSLESLRRKVRATVPRLGVKGPTGRLRFDPPSQSLCYEHGREAGCVSIGAAGTLRFADSPEGLRLEVSCPCSSVQHGCAVRLALLESALDLLGLPERANEAAPLVRMLTAPAWGRTLLALDMLLSGAASEEDRVIAFRVGQSYSGPTIVPCTCKPKKKGGYTLRKLAQGELDALVLTRAEQHAVDLLCPEGDLRGEVSRASTHRAMALLEGHPRVFLDVQGSPQLRVVRTDAVLHAERDEAGAVLLGVRIGSTHLTLAQAESVLDRNAAELVARVDTVAGTLSVIRVPRLLAQAVETLSSNGGALPPEAAGELLDRLPHLSAAMAVAVAPSLRGTEVESHAAPHVRLTLHGDGALGVEVRVRPLPDARALLPGVGAAEVYVHRAEGTVCAVRDLAAESHASTELMARLALPPDPPEPWSWTLDATAGLDALSALGALGDAVEVLWTDERRAVIVPATPQGLKLRVTKDRQWFQLGGQVTTTLGAVPLGELLAAVRDQQRYVRLGPQQWVRIEDALREQLGAAAQLGTGDGARLPALAAPMIEGLAAQGASVDADGAFTDLLERLRAAERFEPQLPAGLAAELRPYQAEGIRWALRLARWAPGACLADDMGLGKTVQALGVLLDRQRLGPALVIAPTSVGFNWLREAARFAPGLRVAPLRGRADLDHLEDIGQGSAPGVVVTSYDLAVRYGDVLSAIRWATVVLDEAQAIKNPATQRAKAVFDLASEFTLALSGTPIENHTGELWSLFQAIGPGLLGSQADFAKRFQVPVERHKDPRVRRALARLVRPFTLRRLKSEVAQELPPRTEVRLDVDLSLGERRLYDELRASALAALAVPTTEPGQRRFQILAALTRLRQLACHPRLWDPASTVGSAKLEVLRELVAELRDNGHRALIFSQFTSLLALVREALASDGVRMRYLDGSTPAARRREEVDAFQAGGADVFLLSLKAGGSGLNLTAADYVIHLDPWWNPAVEDQATDRAHRIGQDRPVTVYRLVARGTVEDGIIALHSDKRELVAAVLDGTGSATALSADELLALIAGGGDADDGLADEAGM